MKKEIITQPSQELINQVSGNMPANDSFQRILLPRLGMFSQDQTEGKGKSMKVTNEAGEFYIEKETDELNEEGKKIWKKESIGTSIEGTVVFYRKQLSMYDQATEKYTSSPIYDADDELIPLFCEKKQTNKGLPKDLKALYAFTSEDGKKKSKLQDNKILYVLYKGEMYQMALKGTSMYSFMAYLRQAIPPTVLTTFNSEPKTNGSTEWNMMTFKTVRTLDNDEITHVLELQEQIKNSIKAEKSYFASLNTDIETDEEKDIRTGESLLKDGKGF